MSRVLLLGFVAGATIFLGLPLARAPRVSRRLKMFLNAFATGVLLFLFVDVMHAGVAPVEEAVLHATEGTASWAAMSGKALLFVLAFGFGLLGLVYYERLIGRRPRRTNSVGAAVAVGTQGESVRALSAAQNLALLIAIGIGLHNFAEGLAIGQSAASGEVQLAILLVVGFALHNATEGFGIVGPLAGEENLPSWGFLLMLGAIGGMPTFLGTLIGHSWVNESLAMVFLALAAGSILYVVVQLLKVALRLGDAEALMWGIFAGLLVGFATDFVLVAAGT